MLFILLSLYLFGIMETEQTKLDIFETKILKGGKAIIDEMHISDNFLFFFLLVLFCSYSNRQTRQDR